MRVVILYRPESEHARTVETFIRDFKMRNPGMKLDPINIDEREGVAMAALYDIMRYPAVMVLATDGTLLKFWNDDLLPLMDEVASYAYSS